MAKYDIFLSHNRQGKSAIEELARWLEDLKNRLQQGFLNSVEYLKPLLDLARDVLRTEKGIDPEEERNQAKAVLTALFQETRTADIPVVVERIVNDMNEIVRIVRFPGWRHTIAGVR